MDQLQRIGWRDRALLIAACVAGFAAVSLVVRDAVAGDQKTDVVEQAPETAKSTEMAALKRRVETLEARVKELETSRARISAVEALPVPPPGVGPHVPDNWVEQDFNGIEFYLVPTEQAQRAVAPPATQPTTP